MRVTCGSLRVGRSGDVLPFGSRVYGLDLEESNYDFAAAVVDSNASHAQILFDGVATFLVEQGHAQDMKVTGAYAKATVQFEASRFDNAPACLMIGTSKDIRTQMFSTNFLLDAFKDYMEMVPMVKEVRKELTNLGRLPSHGEPLRQRLKATTFCIMSLCVLQHGAKTKEQLVSFLSTHDAAPTYME